MRFFVDGLFIMVSGVTSEQDALLSLGLGAHAVAFDFGPTPWRVGSEDVHDILRRLPPGALSIGVFHRERPTHIVEVANRLGLSAVQIHGPAAEGDIAYVAERVNTVLRAVPAGQATRVGPGVDYLVLPEEDDEMSLVASLGAFASPDPLTPVIASGGLDGASVVDVVRDYPVFGVDARACVESEPGVKDPARLGDFIANARWAYENSRVSRERSEWDL